MKVPFKYSNMEIGCALWGHVWTAPSWQELSSRGQHWSARPCVRSLDAVHMTAAIMLRGSGPDQKLAFDNALTQVGCPDRRIDRLCITCCSPSQPSSTVSLVVRFSGADCTAGVSPGRHTWSHADYLYSNRN